MATSKPYRPSVGNKSTPDNPVEVKLVVEKTIGSAYSALEAMQMIGRHWDEAPYGDPVKGHFEFEIDEHLFEVTVTPSQAPAVWSRRRSTTRSAAPRVDSREPVVRAVHDVLAVMALIALGTVWFFERTEGGDEDGGEGEATSGQEGRSLS